MPRHSHEQKHSACCLAHLVCSGAFSLPVHVVCVELVVNGDVEITVVLLAGLVLENAGNGLTLLDCQHVLQVEDGLLPMGVLGVRSGGELDGLVAASEFDIEPRDQGVNEVVAADLELIR